MNRSPGLVPRGLSDRRVKALVLEAAWRRAVHVHACAAADEAANNTDDVATAAVDAAYKAAAAEARAACGLPADAGEVLYAPPRADSSGTSVLLQRKYTAAECFGSMVPLVVPFPTEA